MDPVNKILFIPVIFQFFNGLDLPLLISNSKMFVVI